MSSGAVAAAKVARLDQFSGEAVGVFGRRCAMRPDARAQAAIDVLDAWLAGGDGLDRILAAWGRNNRYAGSGDRHGVADLVYGAVRRMRSATWVTGVTGAVSGRDLLHGALWLEGADPADLFTGARYAPVVLSSGEVATRRSLETAPRDVRLDYPGWLAPQMDGVPDAPLEALRHRAPVFLRVNTLKTTRDAAVRALAAEGIETEACDGADTALRVVSGPRRVQGSEAYRTGLVEVQDAASQIVTARSGVKPGMTVLDLCAGGGGKTLALAALMQGQGSLLAHDIAPARMKDLEARAERAGADVELVSTDALGQLVGKPDLVLVDAPCSGSGAWRRNPDSKWRLTPQRISELEAVQADLIDQAIGLVRCGGRVAYVTCSILGSENHAQISAAVARHGAITPVEEISLAPGADGDGFFLANLDVA